MPWNKQIVSWKDGNTLYLSVVFSWQLRLAELLASAHRGTVIAGGPAVMINGAPWADEVYDSAHIDVLRLHNPDATFTTRGCIRRCLFCAVPKIEGDFRELPTWKVAPVICDNNLTAASDRHFKRVIDSIKMLEGVDFNQGLDCRLFTKFHADQISRLKRRGLMVRFSLDHAKEVDDVARAIQLTRQAGIGKDHISVYVLIGLTPPAECLERLELVRSMGVLPFPMRYQPLDAPRKNIYTGAGWTDFELRRMTRYYSRLNYTGYIPYKEFLGSGSYDMEVLDFGQNLNTRKDEG